MDDVSVVASGPHQFEVAVGEGEGQTHHRVRVPDGFLEQFGRSELDEQTVVEQSFAFLLEREPATSIMGEFTLTVIADYFPDYPDDLRRRLG